MAPEAGADALALPPAGAQVTPELLARAAKVRAAFFDLDGTLLSFSTHEMPASTLDALNALREAGVLLYLATGRPPHETAPVIDELFTFDGYVTMSGSFCFDWDGVFRRTRLSAEDVATMVAGELDGRWNLVVTCLDHTYCNHPKAARIRQLEEELSLFYPEGDIRRALTDEVYQFCAFLDPEDDHLITEACPGVATTRWTPLFADVIPRGGGKPEGVAAALARKGLTMENAIAFGDGENDQAMLAAVGLGVAMGNAADEVKAHAAYSTDHVDEHGIWNACTRLALIPGDPK